MKRKSKNDASIQDIRRGAAHYLARAVVKHFEAEGPILLGDSQLEDDGFSRDFIAPRSIRQDDLEAIESIMRELIEKSCPLRREFVSLSQARFCFRDQPLKVERMEEYVRESMDREESSSSCDLEIPIIEQDGFLDFCLPSEAELCLDVPIHGFKLMRIGGVYWRGDDKNQILQRISALCFESDERLQECIRRNVEAEKRDHRILGQDLELFFFSKDAPGMPYWLPNGLFIYQELIAFWREEHRMRGYMEIASPLVHHQEIWERSGHWEFYRSEMFLIEDPKDPGRFFGLKPMNCPDAMVVFNSKRRSYRELPLRLADCDILHRHEKSGSLHGLLRVRKFSQDDAHIFLGLEHIESELSDLFKLVDRFYSIFGMKYRFRLGLRPEKYVGSAEQWDQAEHILQEALVASFSSDQFVIVPGEGAFYGPKIDILIEDALQREWQMGSVQLDFQLPARFRCEYVNSKGGFETPIVLHRVIYGSMERFIGILLEHCGGHLPLWLAPIQVALLPVSAAHLERAKEIVTEFEGAGIRPMLLKPDSRIPARIRYAKMRKIPLICLVGDDEIRSSKLSVRKRNGDGQRLESVSDFIHDVLRVVGQKLPSDMLELDC